MDNGRSALTFTYYSYCHISDSAGGDSGDDGDQAGPASDSDASVYGCLYCWRRHTDSCFCSPTPRKALAPAFAEKAADDSDQEPAMYVTLCQFAAFAYVWHSSISSTSDSDSENNDGPAVTAPEYQDPMLLDIYKDLPMIK